MYILCLPEDCWVTRLVGVLHVSHVAVPLLTCTKSRVYQHVCVYIRVVCCMLVIILRHL